MAMARSGISSFALSQCVFPVMLDFCWNSNATLTKKNSCLWPQTFATSLFYRQCCAPSESSDHLQPALISGHRPLMFALVPFMSYSDTPFGTWSWYIKPSVSFQELLRSNSRRHLALNKNTSSLCDCVDKDSFRFCVNLCLDFPYLDVDYLY